MDEVLRCDPNERPGTREPRRQLNPRVAAADTDTRVGAIGRWQSFRSEYRQAWLQWRDGDRTAIFPAGTWLMRIRHGALCVPPAPS
jgi:hypothetical protein